LILLLVIPGLLYLVFAKGNMNVFIEVDETGKVKYTSKDLSAHQLEQAQKETENIEVKPVQSTTTTESTDNLGLLTTNTIADGLKTAEDEVFNLIRSGQLKGKKIG
jgi:hypothetical protein